MRWVFGGALIFALSMALIPDPPPLIGALSDKLLHMLAFATLTVLWVAAYPRTLRIAIFVALAALGGLIELVQGTAIISREASLADWGADILAILAVLICLALVRRVCRMLGW
jgi:VanZ family protein